MCNSHLSSSLLHTLQTHIFLAMNNQMFENPIVQDNIKKLISYGYKIIDPAVGHLACGYEEKGKLPKNEEIIEYVKKLIKEKK